MPPDKEGPESGCANEVGKRFENKTRNHEMRKNEL